MALKRCTETLSYSVNPVQGFIHLFFV